MMAYQKVKRFDVISIHIDTIPHVTDGQTKGRNCVMHVLHAKGIMKVVDRMEPFNIYKILFKTVILIFGVRTLYAAVLLKVYVVRVSTATRSMCRRLCRSFINDDLSIWT